MRRSLILFFSVVFCVLMLADIQSKAQVPAGDRILGMHIGASENDDFIDAFNISVGACTKATHLFTPWSSLESAPGFFDGESVEYLDIANIFYPLADIKVELNIAVTNTVTREVPEELESLEWDNDLMIEHFNTLLDSVFSHIPELELVALMIGNESDVMWGADQDEVTHFRNFLIAVKQHAEQLYFNLHQSQLDVGTTITYNGATDAATASIYHDLNQVTDVIGITYYHIGPDFSVLPPGDVSTRWAALDAIYWDMEKPIYIVECGCPSSPVLNGSEAHQSAFVSEVFGAWDEQFSKIKLVFFFMLHDWSQQTVDDLAVYYGLEGVEQFTEFLRTLGLRTYPGNGTDKLAMNTLRCEADARDFCDAVCVSWVDQVSGADLVLFPNPAENYISVDVSLNARVEIYDSYGKLVSEENALARPHVIDIHDFSPGIYSMILQSETRSMISRFVVR